MKVPSKKQIKLIKMLYKVQKDKWKKHCSKKLISATTGSVPEVWPIVFDLCDKHESHLWEQARFLKIDKYFCKYVWVNY